MKLLIRLFLSWLKHACTDRRGIVQFLGQHQITPAKSYWQPAATDRQLMYCLGKFLSTTWSAGGWK